MTLITLTCVNAWRLLNKKNRNQISSDPWNSGQPYQRFMGRWSQQIGELFLDTLGPAGGLRWLDVGCGTGVLSDLVGRRANPLELLGIDPSEAFVAHATRNAQGMPRLRFEVAGVDSIPAASAYFDVAVSGLALNFFPDPVAGLREIARVVKPGGEVAIYVWDYSDRMQMLRHFWDAAVALNPEALPLDEQVRFPICHPDGLQTAFDEAGLQVVDVRRLEAEAHFADFDDYWEPFLGGVGPAPAYVASLDSAGQAQLRHVLQETLPIQPDGSIPLISGAWMIRGLVRTK